MDIAIATAFILYYCILAAIGLFFYYRTHNAADFMLGNRSVNYWVTAIATQASDMSSWLFMGLPAVIYMHGMFQFWAPIGLMIGNLLTWHFIAPRLREQTGAYNSHTLSSFFEQRFNDRSGMLRVVSALLTLIFFAFYISSSLVGLGRLFESAFGVSYHMGVVISLFTTTLYTLLGGFVAVAWCDFFQGMFLLFMIVLVPMVAYCSLTNGISDIVAAAQAQHVSLSLLESPYQIGSALLLAASWGLGYFGMPHILVNFMGIDDPQKMGAAKRIGVTWQFIALTASAAIAFVGLGFFASAPLSGTGSEQIFITMAKTLFHPLFGGLVLCAILAATLSTMDSHILISGTTFANDIYHNLLKKDAPSQHLMTISRLASLIAALTGLALAWNNTSGVYDLVNYAWSGLASSFGPLVIASLYLPRTNRFGALSSMIAGGATAAFWPYSATILPLVPGFIVGFTTIVIASAITETMQ